MNETVLPTPVSDSRREHRLLLASAAVSFFAFAFGIMYLYRFPTLGTSIESDLVLVAVLAIWILSLLVAAMTAKKQSEIALCLLCIYLLAFLARAAPAFRIGVPFLHDSYFYGVASENVALSHSLSPDLSWWYPQVNTPLHWPLMSILSAELLFPSGPGLFWLMLYQAPFVGAFTSVAIFLLTRVAVQRNDVALVAALLGSCSDLVVYYQSEYHPQGLAILLIVLFLYAYLRSRTGGGFALRIFPLLFVPDLVLVHHFSSIFISILAVAFVVLGTIGEVVAKRTVLRSIIPSMASRDATIWALIAVSVLAYNVLVFFGALGGFVVLLEDSRPQSSLFAGGAGVPLAASVLNGAKWGVLAFALFGIAISMRHLNATTYRLLVLLVLLLGAGALANFVVGGPTDRFIALYAPVAAVFAAIGVTSFWVRPSRIGRRRTRAIVALAVTAVCLGGILNVPLPAYYLHSVGQQPYYWSSNDLSSAAFFKPTGAWIREHVTNGSTFLTEFDTWMVPFYYGGMPLSGVRYIQSSVDTPSAFQSPGLAIINPSIPFYYRGVLFNKTLYLQSSDVLYDNGVIVISEFRSG